MSSQISLHPSSRRILYTIPYKKPIISDGLTHLEIFVELTGFETARGGRSAGDLLNFVKDVPIDNTITYNDSVHEFCTQL